MRASGPSWNSEGRRFPVAKVSCRKAFSSELLAQARQNPQIWAMATDSRGSVTIGDFFKELPNQSLELGIAEQNAVAVAAGAALMGKNVFVAGPSCFLTARAYEQIKVDVAYNHTNVKIVGVSAGVSYGPLGCTHTSLHDIAGMRALPGLSVFVPADAVQTRFLTRWLTGYEGPAFLRMGRGDVESVYGEEETFQVGKAKLARQGSDVTLAACGECVWQALQAAELLAQRGVSARVLDFFSIKPFDEEAVIRAAEETGAILTVEEHSVCGGLGEQVARTVVENRPVPVKILGFPDSECRVGASADLFRAYGLTGEAIADQALRLLGKGR